MKSRLIDWLIDWLIHWSAFLGIKVHVALDRYLEPGYNTLHLYQEIVIVQVSIDSAMHYLAFSTVVTLPNSLLNAWVQSRVAVCTILWWSLVINCLGVNPQPTAWEANTLTTKPSRSSCEIPLRQMNNTGIRIRSDTENSTSKSRTFQGLSSSKLFFQTHSYFY